jgi:putative copper export protein
VVDAIHVAAMGIWVGGLAAFLLARDARFTNYARGAIAVSIATGLLLALGHLGSLANLVTTNYGWTLAIKVPVVGAALALALLGRHRIESWVVTVVLALAAVLVSLPPPR